MYTKLNASRSYVYAVAKACDEGKVSRRVSLKVRARAPDDDEITTGLCGSDLVLDGEGCRGCTGGNAVPRWKRLHQW